MSEPKAGRPVLEAWIAQYGPELRIHVSRMVGDDEADDVLQAVWIKAHGREIGHGVPAEVRAWLFRVATNCALDRLRTERRRTRILEEHVAANPPPPPSRGLDDEIRRYVREACARLPPKQRDAVWHRWIEEQDYAEVAERLDSDVPTVRANVHHGLKRLRSELADVWREEVLK